MTLFFYLITHNFLKFASFSIKNNNIDKLNLPDELIRYKL